MATSTTALASLLAQLAPPAARTELNRLKARLSDPRAFGSELFRRGWLTPYQIKQVQVGKGSDLILGPYVVLDKVGEGASGEVFKARHQHMNRIIALKLLRKDLNDPELVQRFMREIEVASQLSHTNVVRAYEAGPIGQTLFLAMEFVDGNDLAQMVKESGKLSAGRACEYIRQAALGLQHAHEMGLVHRDIKPSNLLVTRPPEGSSTLNPYGIVKVLDLGLARLQQPKGSATRNLTVLAGNSVMMGTPDYMSPEQAIDLHSADTRSDVYSLGCTFYFLLTGQPPFAAATLAEKLLKHQTAMPQPVEELRGDLPAGVADVVRKMLAKSPRDRFQKPGEVAAALASILKEYARTPAGRKKTTGKFSLTRRPRIGDLKRWRRHVVTGGMMLVGALALFLTLLYFSLGGSKATENERVVGTPILKTKGDKPPPPPVITWTTLQLEALTSAQGATLTRQPDLSILASGPNPEKDVYRFRAFTDLKGITGIRLEVLPDDSLSSKGPGRAGNGNFVLQELKLAAAPKAEPDKAQPVPLQNAVADHSQDGHTVATIIDGNPATGWAILPQAGQAHFAVLETQNDIGFDAGTWLHFTLEHDYGTQHAIGRFRVSVTTAPRPLRDGRTPAPVDTALAKTKDRGPDFLSDFFEIEVAVGHGAFGKKGELGHGDGKIIVNGTPSPRGLSMHPPANGMSRVQYYPGKKYGTFKGTAAINDTGNSETGLLFKVVGDGKVLWESRPLKNKNETEDCTVPIAGVERLELQVECKGGHNGAHAVWLEPHLLR